jgi:hypothetical protein
LLPIGGQKKIHMLFATDDTDFHELIKKSAPIREIRGKERVQADEHSKVAT